MVAAGGRCRAGRHPLAKSKSWTVAEACTAWIEHCQAEDLERSILAQYRNHSAHITKRIGNIRLGALSTVRVERFRKELLSGSEHFPPMKSRATARKVLTSLKSILSNAQRLGQVAQNVALSVKVQGRSERVRLKIGTDIPSVQEVRKILKVLDGLEGKSGRLRPALMTVIFTGLRASELRGLRWDDVDLKRGEITVRQRADKFHVLGKPKSRAGAERTIPIGPEIVSMLRKWKLSCPNGELNLAFPSPEGEIDQHSNIVRKFELVVRDAGLLDRLGNPKYTGLHSLRHFYASWCINRKEDGGLGLPPKVVQDRLGHSSISMTMDIYGHLFPRGDDGSELVGAERALLFE